MPLQECDLFGITFAFKRAYELQIREAMRLHTEVDARTSIVLARHPRAHAADLHSTHRIELALLSTREAFT